MNINRLLPEKTKIDTELMLNTAMILRTKIISDLNPEEEAIIAEFCEFALSRKLSAVDRWNYRQNKQ